MNYLALHLCMILNKCFFLYSAKNVDVYFNVNSFLVNIYANLDKLELLQIYSVEVKLKLNK